MHKLYAISCVLFLAIPTAFGQQDPYGENEKTGRYVETSDARIYYEVYGTGEPLLLLHGGLYGYINEFTELLPTLIEKFKVIAVATRGHGKSEIGTQPFSNRLFAEDAIRVLEAEGLTSAHIMGFSSGAIDATIIAAEFSQYAQNVVLMAGPLKTADLRSSALATTKSWEGKSFEAQMPGFLVDRKKIMPEPERFAEFVDKMREALLIPIKVSDEQLSQLSQPVLIIVGDRDEYAPVETYVDMYKSIPNAQLLVLPESGHVSLLYNKSMLSEYIIPFLQN